jgi:8-oxo-dGTP diphosphatase
MAMRHSDKSPAAILAAGGIVMADGNQPLIAIVQLRKNNSWALPKGKLKAGEDAPAAAKREILEETGHEVLVHEFLGSMSSASGSKLKIVQFWRMEAVGAPMRELMRDVKAVRWLPLQRAIELLTDVHEQVFLANVGPIALKAAGRSGRDARTGSLTRSSPRASRCDDHSQCVH